MNAVPSRGASRQLPQAEALPLLTWVNKMNVTSANSAVNKQLQGCTLTLPNAPPSKFTLETAAGCPKHNTQLAT